MMNGWTKLDLTRLPDATKEYRFGWGGEPNKPMSAGHIGIAAAIDKAIAGAPVYYQNIQTYDTVKQAAKDRIADGEVGDSIDSAYNLMFAAGYLFARQENKK